MKIIYHACPDGYITEVVFPQGSEIFAIMSNALKRVESIIGENIKNIPQECIEYTCSRGELIEKKGWSKLKEK